MLVLWKTCRKAIRLLFKSAVTLTCNRTFPTYQNMKILCRSIKFLSSDSRSRIPFSKKFLFKRLDEIYPKIHRSWKKSKDCMRKIVVIDVCQRTTILKSKYSTDWGWILLGVNTVHVNRETQPPQEIFLEVSPQIYDLSIRSSIPTHLWMHHDTRLSNWYKCNSRSDTSNCSLNNFSFIISCKQQEKREAQMWKNCLWHISGHKFLDLLKLIITPYKMGW